MQEGHLSSFFLLRITVRPSKARPSLRRKALNRQRQLKMLAHGTLFPKLLRHRLAAVRALAEERLRRIEEQERQLGETRQAAAAAREHAARLEGEAGALRAGLAAAEARVAAVQAEAADHRAERDRLAAEVEAWTTGGPLTRGSRIAHRALGMPGVVLAS